MLGSAFAQGVVQEKHVPPRPNLSRVGAIFFASSPNLTNTPLGCLSMFSTQQVVVDAVKAADPESYLVDSQRLADGCEYRRMSVKGIWTEDVLEFIVAPQPKQPDSALVLYRSMAGTVKYIWPLQQPLSDLDTQKKRMKRVREELGYRLVGCELIECYDF